MASQEDVTMTDAAIAVRKELEDELLKKAADSNEAAPPDNPAEPLAEPAE